VRSSASSPPPSGYLRATRRATDAARHTSTADQTDDDCRPKPGFGEPADHAIGRFRGGLTTKVHALSDGAGRLLVVLLTAGSVHGSPMFAQLLAALRVARTGPGGRALAWRQ
jgi:hypothetical protein